MKNCFLAAVLSLAFCAVTVSVAGSADELPEEPDWMAPIPDVVFIPTPHDVVAEMLRLADISKDDVVYDLGCGDGRILIKAAKEYGCRAVGFDIDPRRVRQSRENVKEAKVEKLVRIEQKDVLSADLSDATVITLYLSPKLNGKLIPKFKTLKPGSRIVSHAFIIPYVRPDKTIHVKSKESGRNHTLYLWKTPLRNPVTSPEPT